MNGTPVDGDEVPDNMNTEAENVGNEPAPAANENGKPQDKDKLSIQNLIRILGK
jgi:hypothetical protein